MKKIIFLTCAILAISGCTFGKNSAVESARNDFNQMADQEFIRQYAPVAYAQAGEAIEKVDQLVDAGAPQEKIEHQAYIAEQRAAIARETAHMNKAREDIAQAEVRRKEVLLKAREKQLDIAQFETVSAREETERAKIRAQQSSERATRLSEELTDLQARETDRGMVITLDSILFDVNKTELKPGANNDLNKIAEFLNEYADRTLVIEGYTDSMGSDDYNQYLSKRRADSVKEALAARGIDRNRIETRGYGEERPVATNDTPAGRQQNRRVEIVISRDDGEESSKNL